MTDKNEFHYFASHAMGWVTAESEEACIEKLLLTNTDSKWVNNCLKAGTPLVFFVTRVPLAADANYRIEWFAPAVTGCTEGKNMLVTYLTKTKFAVMQDPRDEVRTLKRELDAALAELAGYHASEDDAVARAEAACGA